MKPYEHHAKYYETDQMGIIHHSNYIRWMEEARVDMLDQLGLSYRVMEEMGIVSPVLSVACEYKSMAHFDDYIVVEVRAVKYNGVKMELEYKIWDKATGELRAVASSAHCFLSAEGRPISMKRSYPQLDERLRGLLEENPGGEA